LDWVGLLVVVVIYFALLLRRDDEIEDTQRCSDLYQDSIEMVCILPVCLCNFREVTSK
jgi:hypothetical protein